MKKKYYSNEKEKDSFIKSYEASSHPYTHEDNIMTDK